VSIKLFVGDCQTVLREWAADSVDACVTDPPYGLSFMGKAWDYDVPSADIWREVYRVLKPGAHLLAFFGSRTYHRGVVQIEDAGFEIRDQIMWVYGSGFPKSLDVGKAIDKARTEDAEPIRVICRAIRAAMDEKGIKSRHLVEHFDDCHPRLIDHWAARDTDSQPALPSWEQWRQLQSILEIGSEYDAEVWRLNGRKGTPSDTWQFAEIVGEHGGATPGFGAHRFSVRDTKIRAPSDAARQWEGWGTALKPAHEPIVVARKPLIGTVAENVQRHGTGAINIDGSRIHADDAKGYAYTVKRTAPGATQNATGKTKFDDGTTFQGQTKDGRWPANVIHDGSEEVLSCFPDAPGQMADASSSSSSRSSQNVYGPMKKGNGRDGEPSAESDNEGSVGFKMKPGARREDAGSAARFFYCAKASKQDRDEGLDTIPEKPVVTFQTANGTSGKASSISEGRETAYRNTHPTVKPTALMRYLIKLVTPPGGMVLDPFMGSGSTGKAAHAEGFSFAGIERDPQWINIAWRRIYHDSPLFAELAEKATHAPGPTDSPLRADDRHHDDADPQLSEEASRGTLL
jgi:DNA modification methylase